MKEIEQMQAALDMLSAEFDEYKRKMEAGATPEARYGDVTMGNPHTGVFQVCGENRDSWVYTNRNGEWATLKERPKISTAFNIFDVAERLQRHDELVAAVCALLDTEDEHGAELGAGDTVDGPTLRPHVERILDILHNEPKAPNE
jgi:hypothetical protein